ncbi:MAG TPA: ABC transporter permease subunit [Planctomycetota bacterium]|nr:ABC transporter permease subunit [Planctomycetota bacterium]
MAIYDQSYAPWTGTYSSRLSRIRAMIAMELAQPFKNLWVLIIVLFSFSIVGSWLLLLFFATSSQVIPPFALGNRIYREGFYNYPLFSMILMVLSATVGASLIARDVRHHALLMYFSRSITRADYLVGKFLSLVLFLMIVTLGPGLLLFLGQLGMGQERLSTGERLSDLVAITLHSLILSVPMSAVVLAFSSLTKRTYLAAILWVIFYFISASLSPTLTFALKAEWPKMLSWPNLTAHLGDLCYSPRVPSPPLLDCGAWPPLLILGSLTILSLALVWRRLRSTEGEE